MAATRVSSNVRVTEYSPLQLFSTVDPAQLTIRQRGVAIQIGQKLDDLLGILESGATDFLFIAAMIGIGNPVVESPCHGVTNSFD
jgi:hypothetical protein